MNKFIRLVTRLLTGVAITTSILQIQATAADKNQLNETQTYSKSNKNSAGNQALIKMADQTQNAAKPMSSDQDEVVILDKNGNQVVPASNQYNSENIQTPRINAVSEPTSLKYLKAYQTYQSNGFSGSGRRYSGYIFILNSSSFEATLKFSKGEFGVFVLANAGDPNTVITT